MARRGRDEGNIYQRADGRWEARMSLGYDGGRRIRKCFYGRTRREVQERLTRALRDQQHGVVVNRDDRETVEHYLGRWLSDVVKPTVRPKTYATYEMVVRVHLIPGLGRLPLAKLSAADIQQLMNSKLRGGLSPRTVLHIRAVLRRALNQAMRWDLVSRNVASLVDSPRVPRYELRPLSPDEARRLLEATRSDRLGALYAVALLTGLRQGEVLGLTWEDVDLDAGTITVRHALQRVDGVYELVEPKTRRSARTIAIPRVALAILRDHRSVQLQDRLLQGSRWKGRGLVFTTETGSPLDGTNVTHHLQLLLARAGLPRQRFHDLRHACASLLLTQGVHPRVVMEMLGHSQISLTMNTYSHVLPSLQRDAADKLDSLMRDEAKSVG